MKRIALIKSISFHRLPTIPTTPASSTRYGAFADIDGFPSPFSGDLFGIGFDSSHHHLLLQPSQLPTPNHGGPLLLTPHHLLSSTSSGLSTAGVGHQPEVIGSASAVGRTSTKMTQSSAAAAVGELNGHASALDGGNVAQATEDEVSSSCLGIATVPHHQMACIVDRQQRGPGAVGSRQTIQHGSDVDDDMEIARSIHILCAFDLEMTKKCRANVIRSTVSF